LCTGLATRHRCHHAVESAKKTRELITRITEHSRHRRTGLHQPVAILTHNLSKVLRSFGRSCRGQGKVFVTLVRHTEQPLLEVGQDIATLGQQAHACLENTTTRREPQRERLREDLATALRHHAHMRPQSIPLTQGKTLRHCKVVKAYDPTLAPILKGKSHCPAPCGRKPGILSEPATGFLFANLTPQGHPSDAS
jgi:hypothetical protein